MAKLTRAANVEGNNDTNSFEAIPAGEYLVAITKSVMADNKKRNGQHLTCHMKIIEGEFKGRILFELMNLDNPNPVAVDIANKTLNGICQACGKVGVEDSNELHNIPMIVVVAVKPGDAVNPPSNKMKGYKKYGGEFVMEKEISAEEAMGGAVKNPVTKSIAAGNVDQHAPKKKLPWVK